MSWLLDLVTQVRGVLPQRFGGSGNGRGYATGVVKPCLNMTGSTLPLYSLVQLSLWGNDARVCLPVAEESTAVLGVVVGRYANDDGVTLVEADASSPGSVAVMLAGTTKVLIDSRVTRGQYAYSAATAGQAKSLAVSKPGAFGTFQDSTSDSSPDVARVILGRTTQNWLFGSAAEISRSDFGDHVLAGDSGHIADAGHRHAREDDPTYVDRARNGRAVGIGRAIGGVWPHFEALAFDGDDATYYDAGPGAGVIGNWLSVDLGASYGVRFVRVLQPALDGNAATIFKVQTATTGYATGGEDWTDVATRSVTATEELIDLDAAVSARYWRLLVSAGNGPSGGWHWQLCSWELRAEVYLRAGDVPAPSSMFVPTFIAPADTFRVPAHSQALYAMTIDVEGSLDVEGYLIGVD